MDDARVRLSHCKLVRRVLERVRALHDLGGVHHDQGGPEREREEVRGGELRAGGVERAHEVERDVPAVDDPDGEERREEDDAIQPLRGRARVAGLVKEPMTMRGGGFSALRV